MIVKEVWVCGSGAKIYEKELNIFCFIVAVTNFMILKKWGIIFIFTFEIENSVISNANNNVSIEVHLLVNAEINREKYTDRTKTKI